MHDLHNRELHMSGSFRICEDEYIWLSSFLMPAGLGNSIINGWHESDKSNKTRIVAQGPTWAQAKTKPVIAIPAALERYIV
jgi:hypothetical protein